jgi:hypothetical protein
MKKALALIAALLTSGAAYAQGQVNFLTAVGPAANRIVFAPVSRVGAPAAGQGTGAGAGFSAQLVLDQGGTITALTPATTFRVDSPAASFFVVDPGSPVTVPGIASGGSAPLRLRAWDSTFASYDAAVAGSGQFGQSDIANVALGGGLLPPTNLVGLQGFVMVPEPSTIALGVLGAAALLLRRRK